MWYNVVAKGEVSALQCCKAGVLPHCSGMLACQYSLTEER